MFTGLIREVGDVVSIEGGAAGVRLVISAPETAAAAALGAARVAHERLGTAQLPPDAALLEPLLETARSRTGLAWEDSLAQGAQLPLGDAIAEMVDALVSDP